MMTKNSRNVLALLLGLLLLSTCGSQAEGVDNGSNTSWLKMCGDGNSCSGGICVNGVCTLECTNSDDCGQVAEGASCAGSTALVERIGESCDDAQGLRVCVPSCEDGCDSLGSGFECVDGTCKPTACADLPPCSGKDCEPESYDPCQGKACGTPCSSCNLDDPDCEETLIVKACNANGECVGTAVTCEDVTCEALSPDECEEQAACGFAAGHPAGKENALDVLGCVEVGDCRSELTCAVEGDTCYVLEHSCVPGTMERVACDDERCCIAGWCPNSQSPSPTELCQAKSCGDPCDLPCDDVAECVQAHCSQGGSCTPDEVECANTCGDNECGKPCQPEGCNDSELDCGDEVYFCNAAGECVNGDPECTLPRCEVPCGEPCFDDCSPGEDCDVYYCTSDGRCIPDEVDCSADDICQGRTCGDPCGDGYSCGPDEDCVDPDELFCDRQGQCSIGEPSCSDYDPCADKLCGDPCTLCAPGDEDCEEETVEKFCSADLQCEGGTTEACPETLCDAVLPDQCAAAGCVPITGAPAQSGSFDDQQAVGCQYPDGACGDAITCATDSDGACWRFRDTCTPAGWTQTNCDTAACCGPDECPPPAADATWREATFSFGECAGECLFTLTRDANSPSLITYEACTWDGTCARTNPGELTESGLQILAAAEDAINGKILDQVYGCPDCLDGGATELLLELSGEPSAHTYEFSAAPAVLEQLDSIVMEAREALDTCAPTDNVRPTGTDCSPRD